MKKKNRRGGRKKKKKSDMVTSGNCITYFYSYKGLNAPFQLHNNNNNNNTTIVIMLFTLHFLLPIIQV